MVVREIGIMFRGFTLVNRNYHVSGAEKVDRDLRAGLLTAMLNFAETAFVNNMVEYFEGSKYVIVFTSDKTSAEDSLEPEPLTGYAIFDKQKKIDKRIHKIVIPLLKKVIDSFKKKFEGRNFSEVSQFRPFRTELDKIFGTETKKIDQRFTELF